jgi:hypothetical protein
MLFDAGKCLPRFLGKVVLLSAPIDIACFSGARNRDFSRSVPLFTGPLAPAQKERFKSCDRGSGIYDLHVIGVAY